MGHWPLPWLLSQLLLIISIKPANVVGTYNIYVTVLTSILVFDIFLFLRFCSKSRAPQYLIAQCSVPWFWSVSQLLGPWYTIFLKNLKWTTLPHFWGKVVHLVFKKKGPLGGLNKKIFMHVSKACTKCHHWDIQSFFGNYNWRIEKQKIYQIEPQCPTPPLMVWVP